MTLSGLRMKRCPVDKLVQFWLQLWLFVVGLSVATLEVLGYDTVLLWSDILPTLRAGLGL